MPEPQDRFVLLDLLPNPVQIVDLTGRIVFANVKMRELFGDVVGKVCFQTIKKCGLECEDCPRRQTGTRFLDRQVEIDAVNGRKMLVSHSTLSLDGRTCVLESYQDMTEYRRVVEEAARAQAELEMAREIQDRCMTVHLAGADLRYQYKYLPARTTTGDFLDAGVTPDGQVTIALADISGHGVGATVLTLMLKVAYDQLADEGAPMERFPQELNRRMYRYLSPDRFFSLAVVRIGPDRRSCRVVNAGHPPVLHIHAQSGKTDLYGAQRPPLGIAEHIEADPGAVDVPLEEGDRLVLYSDGLFQLFDRSFEQFSRRVQTLGHLRTDRLLESLLPSPAAGIDDDVTVFVAEISGWQDH
jgi:sigma-B regulation protein RsbU (phosphoserine phosphatase)